MIVDIETLWTMIRMIIQGDNDGGPGGALTIIMLQLTRIHTPQLVNKTQRVVSETYQTINEPQKSCLTQCNGGAKRKKYDITIMRCYVKTMKPDTQLVPFQNLIWRKSLNLCDYTWRLGEPQADVLWSLKSKQETVLTPIKKLR